MYVTLEPCCFTGLDRPLLRGDHRGRHRASRRRLDRPEPGGLGARPRAACARPGSRSSWPRARSPFAPAGQNEAWRTWIAAGRPFVTYKVAATLDGRVTAAGLALAVAARIRAGACTSCARPPTRSPSGWAPCWPTRPGSMRARSAPERQPRRLAFGKRPAPGGLGARAPLAARSPRSLRALAQEGVQSLLLEGGPTLATAFVEADLVDKLLVFVTPHLAGAGPSLLGELLESRSGSRA